MRRLKQNGKLKGILRLNKETGARVEGMKDREVERQRGWKWQGQQCLGKFVPGLREEAVILCALVCVCVCIWSELYRTRSREPGLLILQMAKHSDQSRKLVVSHSQKHRMGVGGLELQEESCNCSHTTLAVSECQRDCTQILKKKKKDQQDRSAWMGTVKIYLWWTKSSAY